MYLLWPILAAAPSLAAADAQDLPFFTQTLQKLPKLKVHSVRKHIESVSHLLLKISIDTVNAIKS